MQVMSEKYEEKMLKAFIGRRADFAKDIYFWYLEAFKPYREDSTAGAKWKWSWWGFFLGFFFLAYRKAYMASIVVLIITGVLSLIPYGQIIIAIFTGGYSNYFIYNVYLAKKLKIEKLVSDEDERIEIMRKRGGYNRWVIFLPLGIIIFGILSAIIIPRLAS